MGVGARLVGPGRRGVVRIVGVRFLPAVARLDQRRAGRLGIALRDDRFPGHGRMRDAMRDGIEIAQMRLV